MATISKLNGVQDPSLMAQVADTTRPRQEAAPRPDIVNDEVKNKIPDPPQSTEIQQQTIDTEQIQEIATRLQESLDRVAKDQHQVTFHMDSQSNQFVIEIKNTDGTVVKQFPPEKVLNQMRKLDDLSGMVIDEMT